MILEKKIGLIFYENTTNLQLTMAAIWIANRINRDILKGIIQFDLPINFEEFL